MNRLFYTKKILIMFFILLIISSISGCSKKVQISDEREEQIKTNIDTQIKDHNEANEFLDEFPLPDEGNVPASLFSFLSPEADTLEGRINPPEGFQRIPTAEGELTSFLRNMKLKPDGSKVHLYDGTEKSNQNNHIAVFDLDVGSRDLQQCADSIIRVYAEYYWSTGEYDKIAFHLTNGFFMEYSKWQKGNRIIVEGNTVRWSKKDDADTSYENMRKYLDMVFAYAGTLSLSQECNEISLDKLVPGDLFLQGGSPGHCVLVVDIAQDESGDRCFLLAQGYMPAQEFHIIKNPLYEDNPWYYTEEITFPLITPSWTFEEGSLVRWGDFPLQGLQGDAHTGEISSMKHLSDPSASLPALSQKLIIDRSTSKQVTLLAVGDNLIHSEVIQSGKQADGSYNFDHLYSNLKQDITNADIAVINQETILGGDDFPYSGYPNFNSPYEIGEAVADVGFDVILHATNHTMDMGEKGIHNTLSFWARYPDIKVLGINESEEQQNEVPIIEKNGIKIAMLNYTYGLNGYRLPKNKPFLVNLLDNGRMTEDIKKAKDQADFVIVFPHWGTEYVYEATDMQKKLTSLFYELGADLVIGSHPHVIEPVEWFEDRPEHKMLAFYSLGNFMSYQKEAPRMLGGMAKLTITKDEKGTYISEAGITPIITHFEHGIADFNYGIFKLSDYTPKQAMSHGVSHIAKQGALTYEDTYELAKTVLGSWFVE